MPPTDARWIVSGAARFAGNRGSSRRTHGYRPSHAALTGGSSIPSILAGVVHQQHRDAKLPLQRAKIPQQLGDRAGVILVNAVKSHQRVEHQQLSPAIGLSPKAASDPDRDRAAEPMP